MRKIIIGIVFLSIGTFIWADVVTDYNNKFDKCLEISSDKDQAVCLSALLKDLNKTQYEQYPIIQKKKEIQSLSERFKYGFASLLSIQPHTYTMRPVDEVPLLECSALYLFVQNSMAGRISSAFLILLMAIFLKESDNQYFYKKYEGKKASLSPEEFEKYIQTGKELDNVSLKIKAAFDSKESKKYAQK